MRVSRGAIQKAVIGVVVVSVAIAAGLALRSHRAAHGPATFTVNSTADGDDAKPGDGRCRTAGTGPCTLRAAITEANRSAGAHTIDFHLPGRGVQTIRPRSALPAITRRVTIDGYSQPGARANRARSPRPLDGTLTIELDGEDTRDVTGLQLRPGADRSVVTGLVVNRFGGIGIDVTGVAGTKVQGDYIGTDPTGRLARPNGNATGPSGGGLSVGAGGKVTDRTTRDTLVGGSDPADRSIFSGNDGAGIAIGSVRVTVQGNYVGVGADGLTRLGNGRSIPDQSGGITIDNADGVTVGGTTAGAGNIFSGNDNSGISSIGSRNLTLQGNSFGLGFDGTTVVPNDTGLQLSGCSRVQVGGPTAPARNLFSGNAQNGLGVDEASSDVTVYGNYIGTDASGLRPIGNKYGIGIADSSHLRIGGAGAGEGNLIANNTYANVVLQINEKRTGGTDSTIQGNHIGTDRTGAVHHGFTNGIGVLIYGPSQGNVVGGVRPGEGNVVAGNTGGVLIGDDTLTPLASTWQPHRNAVLGNSISANATAPALPGFTQGLGIDRFAAVEDDLPPNGADRTVASGPGIAGTGAPTGTGDAPDAPVLTSVTRTGTDLVVGFDLTAAGSPTGRYRVELFATDAADQPWQGAGQTFLGALTVGPGPGQRGTVAVPADLDLTGATITATATAVDGSTGSGFGATSEFSSAVPAGTTRAPN